MNIGFVGCGFVSEFYLRTLVDHPELRLRGVTDRDASRAARIGRSHRVPAYPSLEAMLADGDIGMVVNLTSPSSHFEVSRRSLAVGKHVYSEKPLALSLDEARELAALARSRGLGLACAPCSVLGAPAQTAWNAVRDGVVGPVRLALAEVSDGPLHLKPYMKWRNASGLPWPFEEEMRLGCVIEHSGYALTWLVSFFGAARAITPFSSRLIPATLSLPESGQVPDFSTAGIEFDGGVVARLTCSVVAPFDRSLRLVGDKGVLTVADMWRENSRISFTPSHSLSLRLEKHPLLRRLCGAGPRRYPLIREPRTRRRYRASHRMDFARGVAELAAAVESDRPSRLPTDLAVHVTELTLKLHEGATHRGRRILETDLEHSAGDLSSS